MNKLLITFLFAGIISAAYLIAQQSDTETPKTPKYEHPEWMKQAKIEVIKRDDGVVIRMTSENKQLVKKIQEWASTLPYKKPTEDLQKRGRLFDPVCKMMVDPETAIKLKYDGKDYYFCSYKCSNIFLENPTKYIGKAE